MHSHMHNILFYVIITCYCRPSNFQVEMVIEIYTCKQRAIAAVQFFYFRFAFYISSHFYIIVYHQISFSVLFPFFSLCAGFVPLPVYCSGLFSVPVSVHVNGNNGNITVRSL